MPQVAQETLAGRAMGLSSNCEIGGGDAAYAVSRSTLRKEGTVGPVPLPAVPLSGAARAPIVKSNQIAGDPGKRFSTAVELLLSRSFANIEDAT